MICRRLAPLVVVAFLAAHIAACACRISGAVLKAPAKKAHACCHNEKPAPVQKPPPASCCCADGSHEAISEQSGDAVSESGISDAVPDLIHVCAAGQASRISGITGSPPGRAPGVLLFTLHAALLI